MDSWAVGGGRCPAEEARAPRHSGGSRTAGGGLGNSLSFLLFSRLRGVCRGMGLLEDGGERRRCRIFFHGRREYGLFRRPSG